MTGWQWARFGVLVMMLGALVLDQLAIHELKQRVRNCGYVVTKVVRHTTPVAERPPCTCKRVCDEALADMAKQLRECRSEVAR